LLQNCISSFEHCVSNALAKPPLAIYSNIQPISLNIKIKA